MSIKIYGLLPGQSLGQSFTVSDANGSVTGALPNAFLEPLEFLEDDWGFQPTGADSLRVSAVELPENADTFEVEYFSASTSPTVVRSVAGAPVDLAGVALETHSAHIRAVGFRSGGREVISEWSEDTKTALPEAAEPPLVGLLPFGPNQWTINATGVSGQAVVILNSIPDGALTAEVRISDTLVHTFTSLSDGASQVISGLANAPLPATITALNGVDDPAISAVKNVTPFVANSTPDLLGARVSTLLLDPDVEAVEIVTKPEVGNLTVNPDNTLALVLSDAVDYSGPLTFTYEVTRTGGAVEEITLVRNVLPSLQDLGWPRGDFYMLETDEDDNVIVEPGDVHRKIHVSVGPTSFSRADIAAAESLAVEAITDEWIEGQTLYGSEAAPLQVEPGMALWARVTDISRGPQSNWILFERGYNYGDVGRLPTREAVAPNELHPMLIGAFGAGAHPIITGGFNLYQRSGFGFVLQGIDWRDGAVSASLGGWVILDNCFVREKASLNIQNIDGFTLRNSFCVDRFLDQPKNGGTSWSRADHVTAIFAKSVNGLLLEGNFFDRNGWSEGFNFDLSLGDGQPPNALSHNVYIQYDCLDVTVRYGISARAASQAYQVRPGGFIHDNFMPDSNMGGNVLGGDYKDRGPIAYFSQFYDNVVTSAGFRQASGAGSLAQGFAFVGELDTAADNILCHLADPANPAEQVEKFRAFQSFLFRKDPSFDINNKIWNWVGGRQIDSDPNAVENTAVNVDGLDRTVLNQTTIQTYTAQLLDQPVATIPDYIAYVRSLQPKQIKAAAADATQFFRTGFGLHVPARTTPATLRFFPKEYTDGMRWDNRRNWTTNDLPGQVAGDSVNLAGNWVNFGGTVTINDLAFGSDGKLNVGHGRLAVGGTITSGPLGASLTIERAGQVFLNGYAGTDELRIGVTKGRFANTGAFTGTFDLSISNGQALLAVAGASMTLNAGSAITITGQSAKVGFDGSSGAAATLTIAGGDLTFVTGATGVSGIGEFRSGKFGDAPVVASEIALTGGALIVDITGLDGAARTMILAKADTLTGTFASVSVPGLGAARDATLTYDAVLDEVRLSVTAAGAGTGLVSVVSE